MSPSPRSGRRRGGPPRSRSSSSSSSSPGRTPRSSAKPLTPVENPPEIESFEEWELGEQVQGAIRAMGITRPTPIQALAIGEVLAGRDVIAKAETGTGKTLAFGAPLMARIDPARASVLGLVLSPTRELSEQVYTVLEKLGEARGVKVALVVGGEPLHPQVRDIQAGAQVVVATPGRVLDLMGQGFLSFPWTEFVVLDEADKMLEIGFIDDIKKILEATDPDIRQTLLFSATFPPPLLELAREHTREPAEIATASGLATVDTIAQTFLRLSEEDVPRALGYIFEDSAPEDVFLVFCERRTDVDKLMRRMERLRFPIKALHGGYDQAARFRVMSAFRTGEVKALLATDVASRGLDVQHVTHVINVGVPRDVSDYTHRIGRTGRAGRKGIALTLVTPRDERRWRPLIAQVPWTIQELTRPRDLLKVGAGAASEEPPRRRERGGDERGGRGSRGGTEREDGRRRRRREEPAPEEAPREAAAEDTGPRTAPGGEPSGEAPRRERRRPRRSGREDAAPAAEARGGREEREPRRRSRREGGESASEAPPESSARRPRRPAGDGEGAPSGRPREERPRRRREPAAEESKSGREGRKKGPEAAPSEAPGGFGAGVDPTEPRRERPARRRRPSPGPQSPPTADPERGRSGGFGAGL